MKILKRTVSQMYLKISLCLWLLSMKVIAFANNVIPISDDDTVKSGESVITAIIRILQKEVLPLVEIGGGAIVLLVALNGLWKGYKEYQRERDLDPLKHAIVASVLLMVLGGTVLYLIDTLRSYTFS